MKKLLILLIIVFLTGCQQQIHITCQQQEICYMTIEDSDELDFSNLMSPRVFVDIGETIEINIKNDNVEIKEYVLKADGSLKYDARACITMTLDSKENVSFEIGSELNLDSNSTYEEINQSLRGYVVEYDQHKIGFVLETNVTKAN